MKILIKQFLGKNHSWAHVGWEISKSLISKGHEVHLFSTDGKKYLPEELLPYLIGYNEENQLKIYGKIPDKYYDAQISYTAMKNFPLQLAHGNKNRFGIWCYEWMGKNILPFGFAKHYKSCDKLLPPSLQALQTFVDSGIPKESMEVIPHGISNLFINGTSTFKINSDKKFKVLANIAQPHLRKNIPGLLEAWGKAFTKKDDVCLVLKISNKKTSQDFEVDINKLIRDFKIKFNEHAEIITISEYLADISQLYRACNAFISLSHAESFLLPALEALSSNKIVLVSASGGQMDFCNEKNSILVQGKYTRANRKSMYWQYNENALWFEPDLDVAAEKLQYIVSNEEKIIEQFCPSFKEIREKYTWDNVTNKIINLCQNT